GEGPSPDADKDLSQAIGSMPTVIGADTGFTKHGQGASHYSLERLLEPYSDFAISAESVGLTKMPLDDGVVRRFLLPRSNLTKNFPQLYQAAVGVNSEQKGLPSDRDLIWYYGPPGEGIISYPYHTVILDSDRIPPERFKDKIVFVGLYLRTALGPAQKDSFETPFRGEQMFGVEIQATAAANLLQRKWVQRMPIFAELVWLGFLTLGLSLLMIRFRPQWGFLILFISVIAWMLIAYAAFLSHIFMPGSLLFFMVLPAVYTMSTLRYYIETFHAQQEVERAFRLYLPPEMARQMRSNPQALKPGGEELIGTALFTDIAGFTKVSEKMKPSEVSAMLNAYFTKIIDVIFEYEGTLIEFMGDAVYVIWGAPIKRPDHAERASRCAIQMQLVIKEFIEAGEFPPLQTRIGIHTGSMLVGNLGSTKRFTYTAIGDSVNLASRLEGINKYFGTSILISENVVNDLSDQLNPLFLGKITVAGRVEAVKIYTLLEEKICEELQTLWLKGLEAYMLKDWFKATQIFREILNESELLAKASNLYLSEITRMKIEGVPEAWNGEIRFIKK
ncbi:MAG: adenylate/guanylate cyclase domain-containing protein, partial [SAR324 cluster bacterium]|nr:adenylate/guanylate cyclase domain-containing protein [SAR324 cluster bacterium]